MSLNGFTIAFDTAPLSFQAGEITYTLSALQQARGGGNADILGAEALQK
jgi:hypothetical protein